MIVFDCDFLEPHTHEYPDDWNMGPNGDDPRADPRYEPSHYKYYDANLSEIWVTGTNLCDEEALDTFSMLNFSPVYIAVKRPGSNKYEFMNWLYVADTDSVHPYQKVEA